MKLYSNLYSNLLPFFLTQSTISGFAIGLNADTSYNAPKINSINKFANLIGFTSIGIITGLTYPISYPLLGLYVIFNKT